MQFKTPDGNVVVAGTVGRDAEYKRVGESGIDLTTFSLAIGKRDNGSGEKETIWVSVNCWRGMAPQGVMLKKGDGALVIGQPGSRTYTGKDGLEHKQTFLNADMVIPVPKLEYLPSLEPPAPQSQYSRPEEIETEEFDGDLPF